MNSYIFCTHNLLLQYSIHELDHFPSFFMIQRRLLSRLLTTMAAFSTPRDLYPAIEPFATGMLEVTDGVICDTVEEFFFAHLC